MKRLFLFILVLIFTNHQLSFAEDKNKKYEIGISAGIISSSDVWVSLHGDYINQNANFFLKGYFDYFIIPELSFGLYTNFTTISLEKDIYVFDKVIKKSGTPILEFGGSVKPRIELSEKLILKPGASAGYREYFGENDFTTWKGFSLDGSAELQYLLNDQLKLFTELGFLFQPYGGNKDTDVTFDPTLYLVVGVSF